MRFGEFAHGPCYISERLGTYAGSQSLHKADTASPEHVQVVQKRHRW
jgi:hypothetical protein